MNIRFLCRLLLLFFLLCLFTESRENRVESSGSSQVYSKNGPNTPTRPRDPNKIGDFHRDRVQEEERRKAALREMCNRLTYIGVICHWLDYVSPFIFTVIIEAVLWKLLPYLPPEIKRFLPKRFQRNETGNQRHPSRLSDDQRVRLIDSSTQTDPSSIRPLPLDRNDSETSLGTDEEIN
ncbi:unnamed protein product, partial [Mesorhabditis belari]|uniref:Uncharacterized protein n=1 Tax=Mesorhabditis belari TaxID=2138241 RepID=A0AAF3EKR8_9BILA